MSGLPFELLLALRYLRPKRTFVSVITLISALGVTLGVAVLIIVLSVMSGFDRDSREKILGFNPHLMVYERNHTMKDYSQVEKVALADPRVKAAAATVLEQVLVVTEPPSGQRQVWAPSLRGIVPQTETNISILPRSIVEGEFDVTDRGLLVGKQLASALNLAVHDRVQVYAPNVFERLYDLAQKNHGELPPGTSIPVAPEFDVRGIYDVGYFEYNHNFIIGSLRDTQDLYGLGKSVHGVVVMLRDPYQAPEVQKALERALGPKYTVTTWMEENAALLGALIVEKNVMFYLLFFIMIVAALCILSALITFVVQKTREIGMLKALGAEDLQVSLLFLSQGALVGFLGVVAGFGLGMLALAYRNEFLDVLDRLFGFELFPASIYNFTRLPSLIIPRDIMLVCGSALLVCTLGGAIPAWLAGRLKPVDALRYE